MIVESKIVNINEISANDWNPNVMTDSVYSFLKKSISKYGFCQAVIVTSDMTIVDGEHRWRAMKDLGESEIEVKILDISDEEAKANTVNFNLTRGKFDDDMLGLLLEEISDVVGRDELKDLVVMPDQKIDALLNQASQKTQVEDTPAPEVTETAILPGDIFILNGTHRVMCGDSADPDQVGALMGKLKADMVFTDPPYGVNYRGGVHTRRDKLTGDGDISLYAAIIPNLVKYVKKGAGYYIWYSDSEPHVPLIFTDNGFERRSTIIWVKNQAQYGALSAQYKQKHEPCLYLFRKGGKPNWYGDTRQVTVWDVDRDSTNKFHPTQKPLKLCDIALINSSKPEDVILDLFLGSGTTLISCEANGRICRGMELEPKFVESLLRRYHEQFPYHNIVCENRDLELNFEA